MSPDCLFEVAQRAQRRAISAVHVFLAVLLAGCLTMTGRAPARADPASTQAKQWWIAKLDLKKTWAVSKGAGVTVALLDTGVNASLGDLQGAVVPGFDTTGSGTGQTDTDTAELHGTRLASLIAGRGTDPGVLGVAPQAKILPVVGPDGGGNEATLTALNRLSAMTHPPDVVNMSYGAVSTCHADLQAAIKKAVDKGMILVAAAGNDGAAGNSSQSPANCAGVIAVGAVDESGDVWAESERQPYVGLAAPGVHMVGKNPSAPGVITSTGTSDATAIISGILADVRAKYPTMPSRQLVARVLYTTHAPPGGRGTRNDTVGFGVALPMFALTDKVPASAPNPIYDAMDRLLGGPSTSTPSGPGHTTRPST